MNLLLSKGFLLFINGKCFLILYILYLGIIIFKVIKILNDSDIEKYVCKRFLDDEYYVLINKYNFKNMFYYIIYKLYVKGILLRNVK